ncbi:MAG: PQQ-binding-like beta-propeller repeat protein [Actinomycetia bacterium]|nr:PQQ-binding-like beta-propeller repeat protein [Actinomycetes bacterium]
MRKAVLLSVSLALLASACVAGNDNLISAGPGGSSVTTLPPIAPTPSSTKPTGVTDSSIVDSSTTSSTTTVPPRPAGVVTAESVYKPWGSVNGLTMFRGNPTRTFFGSGPVPKTAPSQLWRYPEHAMTGSSPVGREPKTWSGTGWTGQPVVYEREDGKTEMIFGAYDKKIHFVDADTGTDLRPSFDMGDIIKGSVTLDPDGFPLVYTGSRDPRFRILAIDGDEVREVWSLHAKSVEGIWNDDWDSNPVIVDDMLYQGGENSWWFAVKLNRGYDEDGNVTVDPKVVWETKAWSDELLEELGRDQSVENSTAVFGQKAYFANSAGRIQGVDLTDIENGNAEVFFDFWTGDDTDATISIDDEGFIYVVSHADHEKDSNLAARRVREIGSLMKLDTSIPANDLQSVDPIVWRIELPAARGQDTGAWATPALHPDGVIFVATDSGELVAVDTQTGDRLWEDDIGVNAWSSPVIVDDTLVIAIDCFSEDSGLRAYDVSDPRNPTEMWTTPATNGCIESTPAVWNGTIYVGSRDGFMYAFGS